MTARINPLALPGEEISITDLRLFNSQLAVFCQQDSFGPILETLDSDLNFFSARYLSVRPRCMQPSCAKW